MKQVAKERKNSRPKERIFQAMAQGKRGKSREYLQKFFRRIKVGSS